MEYEGECSDASGQKYWHPQKEFLYLKTNCIIDTTTSNGWTPYLNNKTVRQLLKELQKFLIHNRFTNIRVSHIKRQ